MGPELVLSIFRDALWVITMVIMVVLLPALGVGILVAMFQAATSINEQTLSFIPKILITLTTLIVAGPWILQVLLEFTNRLITSIPMYLGGGM